MKVEYHVEVIVTAASDDDPADLADLVFAAISYSYSQLGGKPAGDPRPGVDLAVAHVVDSRRVRGRLWDVRLLLRVRADEDMSEETIREAVVEKLTEALDSPGDGQINEFVMTGITITRMAPGRRLRL